MYSIYFMNTRTYYTADRYARAMAKEASRDLLHDTYLDYHDKTGKDIFDESPVFVIVCMKNRWFSTERNRTTWQYKKVKYPRTWVEFDDSHRHDHVTPLDLLIVKESKQRIETLDFRKSAVPGHPNMAQDIVAMKQEGYKNFEIAKIIGVHKSLITWFVKRLKEKYTQN